MENRLNEFDQLVKNTYENHEFPYDPSAWDELEEELNAATPSVPDYFKSITTGLAITGAIFASMLMYFSGTGDYSTPEKITENEGIAVQQKSQIATSSDKGKIAPFEEAKEEEGEFENTNQPSVKGETTAEKTTSERSALAPSSGDKVLSSDDENPETSNEVALESSEASVRTGCTGLTIRFDAPEEYGKDAKYLWNFGDGYFSNEANPSHTFNKEGVFDVSLSVTSLSSGQISSNVVQAMIEVVDAPVANFDLVIASMDEIALKNNSSNAENTDWEINGESQGVSSDISLSLTDNTKYEVRLLAQADGTCVDTLEKSIHVVKAGNQFPKAYSSAYATDYSPGAIVDNGQVMDFRVYDKSNGEEVYRSSGPKGWDGTKSNGESAKKGEYVWVMVVDSDESVDIYKGVVNLR